MLWEENRPFTEIIYGDLYRDHTAILLTVSPGSAGESMNAVWIDITGHEVQLNTLNETEIHLYLITLTLKI